MTAKEKREKDGSGTVEVDKVPYRPKLPSLYTEPEYFLEDDEYLDIACKGAGKALLRSKQTPPPRTDIIVYNTLTHKHEFDSEIRWRQCPQRNRQHITSLIQKYWDAFAREGLKRTLLGYEFFIDVGQAKPTCAKHTRYGHHEQSIMKVLVDDLEANGLIEDDFGPWGAIIVLAIKAHQQHKHWSDVDWRLCVSYRSLNAITRPFAFHAQRCDDAVDLIPCDAKYFISLDLKWGYWQLKLHEASRDKTAFFVPEGKKHWKVVPMGILNAHPCFCYVVGEMQKEWRTLFHARIHDTAKTTDSKCIVDDILIYSPTLENALLFLECVLQVLVKYRVTVGLSKCNFLAPSLEFVAVDVSALGNAPAKSKFPALEALTQAAPKTATAVLGIIGFLGFYQLWIPWFEVRINRWRRYKKDAPPLSAPKAAQQAFFKDKWTVEDHALLCEIVEELKAAPFRKRPDHSRRFYLKTDFSNKGMGGVLLQADPASHEALRAEQIEIAGGPSPFDREVSNKQFRLLPIAMISRTCTKAEESYHSFTGEACTGIWAMEKFRPYLWYCEFTWLTDCAALKSFLSGQKQHSHQMNRIVFRMLQYQVRIEHRAARMLTDADFLSRYNAMADTMRLEGRQDPKTGQLPTSTTLLATMQPPVVNIPVQVKGNPERGSTFLARAAQRSRVVWEIGSAFSTIPYSNAFGDLQVHCSRRFEPREEWNATKTETSSIEQAFIPLATDSIRHIREASPPDWLVIHVFPGWETQHVDTAVKVVQVAFAKGTEVVWIFAKHNGQVAKQLRDKCSEIAPNGLNWSLLSLRNTDFGGAIEAEISVTLLARPRFSDLFFEKKPPAEMADRLPQIEEIKHSLRKRKITIDSKARQQISPSLAFTVDPNQVVSPIDESSIDTNQTPRTPTEDSTPHKASVAFFTKAEAPAQSEKVYNPDGPAPTIRPIQNDTPDHAFKILCGAQLQEVRMVTWAEVLDLYGFEQQAIQRLAFGPHAELQNHIAAATPREIIQACFNALYHYESAKPTLTPAWMATTRPPPEPIDGEEKEDTNDTAPFPLPEELSTADINMFTTYPLPSLEDWQRATTEHRDLQRVCNILEGKETLTDKFWEDKAFYEELKHQRLEIENKCLFRYEVSKRVSMQQIRVRVVPNTLQPVVLAFCHASPFSGHSSERKTLWRCQTHYWWPTMRRDVREACRSCAHCNAANITSHEASTLLKNITATVPFDIMCFDYWKPGDETTIPSPTDGGGPPIKAMLTGMCIMTSFVTTGEVFAITAEESARVIMTKFFCVYGIPKLIILDQDSAFKDILVSTCKLLQVKYHPVTKGNHKAILCERFHRYLNKVERIHAADCETLSQWYKGHALAAYAWNAAPIDGINVTRSFAAIGREFPFTLDVNLEEVTTPANNEWAEWTLDHIDAMFPLLLKQRELLHLLTEDRREFHRETVNKNRKSPTFEVGDLALVRVQVKSQKKHGPAKIQMKARGPYRILEKVSDTTYRIQRLPFHSSGPGSPHQPYVESVARLTKLPKTLIIHKHVDGVDTRWATLRHPFGLTPLHQSLRATGFGKFIKANPTQPWAFEKIEDIMEQLGATTVDIADDGDQPSQGDPTDESAHSNPESQEGTTNEERENPQQQTNDLSHILGDNPAPLPQTTPAHPRWPHESPTQPDATPNSWPAAHFADNVTENIFLPDSPPQAAPASPPQLTPIKRGPLKGVMKGPKKRKTNAEEPPTTPTNQSNNRSKSIDKFLRRLQQTEDRMVFVQYKPAGQATTRWYVAQVPTIAPEEVKRTGKVLVEFFVRHHLDSHKRTVGDCRFWPEVHDVDQTTNTLGKIVPIRPNKVAREVQRKNGKLMQFMVEVNVPNDILLGPMNFSPARLTGNRPHCFHKTVWDALKNSCKFKGVSTSNIDTIQPLS